MTHQLLTLLICCLLVACSGSQHSVPPVFTGKAASELPVRIKSHSYPTYRQGVPYEATARYRYDAQNRLVRIDSTSYGESVTYQYTDNRLSERQTYQNGTMTGRTQFFYNANGQLEKTLQQNGAYTSTSTYRFDTYGQLIEKVTTQSLSTDYIRVRRYAWRNGNMVAQVELDGKGQKLSEWSFTYDEQPNYQALLPVNPAPDEPLNYNNTVKSQLDKDYTGLIDLCVNPSGTQYTYRSDGLVSHWENTACSFYYNDIEYEPKQ